MDLFLNGLIEMKKPSKIRRFWNKVSFIEDEEGYKIYLDKNLLKLPQKNILVVSQKKLAQKIAEEWSNAGDKKGDYFSFETLSLTRIVSTLLEKIKPNRQYYIDALMPYINGELLCYRAEKPKQLVEQQNLKWQPIFQWAEQFLTVQFKVTQGIMPIVQDSSTLDRIQLYLNNLSDEELTFFAVIMPLLGSMILSIALKEKKISVDDAFAFAYLDEEIQTKIWGYDSEQEQRLLNIRQEIKECNDYLNYLH